MGCEPATESARRVRRRYMREMTVATVTYVAFVFGAAYAIRNFELPQWTVIVLSLLPTAPAVLMMSAYLVYVRALDEFQRRIQTEALIVAIAITAFGSFAYGFLEEWADFPHVPLLWVFPVFCALFGVAHAVIRRRYK